MITIKYQFSIKNHNIAVIHYFNEILSLFLSFLLMVAEGYNIPLIIILSFYAGDCYKVICFINKVLVLAYKLYHLIAQNCFIQILQMVN